MDLTINGNPKAVENVSTVADLLKTLNLDPRKVVVELNEKIVRRDQVDRVVVDDNDRIEILRFVGGG